MTPVTNKPPMPQAPGKGIKSFPTPVIDDVVITEIVNAWKGDYKALDYGVKWDEAPHASMQGSHPDHKLVFQDPASADGEWIKRIWVNDRVNQDSYNYAIKYSGGSQIHPIYIRTYVLPRDSYVPLPDLTPDEVYPTALLVEEEVQRNEGELDSKYIKVVRVFETLQGPEINSFRYNERGDLEEVINQQVTPDTLPDPDGLLVTQSQVIKQDVSKGTKTTAIVPSHSTLISKEKKEGLLGETIVTDDIVDPSTSPDSLSISVISSSVEQTSKTKARKRTVTSNGPKSLVVKSLSNSPIGDVSSTITKSIVSPNTIPQNSFDTIKDTITSIDAFKSLRENVKVNLVEGNITGYGPNTLGWPILNGTETDRSNGLSFMYKETIVPAETLTQNPDWTNEWTEFTPIDSYKLRFKYYDQVSVSKKINEYFKIQGNEVNVKLPDTLLEITAYFGLDNGKGTGSSEGSGAGNSYNYSVTGSYSSSSSATGDIYFKIQRGYEGPVGGYKVEFFDRSTLSRTSVINKIKNSPWTQNSSTFTSLKEFPKIKRITENLVVIGGSKSKSISKSESASVSLNGSSNALSENTSFNVGVSANSVLIPETLHKELTITKKTIGSLGDINVSYSISPPIIKATEYPEFPAGIYLMSIDTELYRFGYFKYTAIIADITTGFINRGTN